MDAPARGEARPPWVEARLRRVGDGAVVCERVIAGRSFVQRFRGLMGRAALAEDEGLYLETASIHMMFMRFPIDALFLARPEEAGVRAAVGVRPNLPPWRGLVLPVRGAQSVIELPAGTLAREGVAAGDRFALEPLGAWAVSAG
jgi:hypothetical protein